VSSLIFLTDEDNVVVATDTLVVTPDGEPSMFTSKAIYLPHLKVIVAGTGLQGFASEWALKINDKLIVNGINNLDHHTPHCLRELWIKYKSELLFGDEMTTTVYQFGFSQMDGNIVVFAYRSTNDFKSEKLTYGIKAKPECTTSFEENDTFMDVIPKMMREQRKIEDEGPKDGRLYIGGEIQVLHLTRDRCLAFKLGEFDDIEDAQQKIFARCK
jgi:hypothetical protein